MTPPISTEVGAPAILYSRVSTDDQAESGLGLADQSRRLIGYAASKGWDHTIDLVDEGISAKSLDRPAMAQALAALEAGEASALVTTKLDRLTRKVGDLADLMQRSDEQGWALVIIDLGVDTSTASGKMVANVMGAVAQWERETIAERTKAALAAKKARGEYVGGRVQLPISTRLRIYNARQRGVSYTKVVEQLTADKIATARKGTRWHRSTVVQVMKSIENERAWLAHNSTPGDPNWIEFEEAFGPIVDDKELEEIIDEDEHLEAVIDEATA